MGSSSYCLGRVRILQFIAILNALTHLTRIKKGRLILFVYTHSHDETGDLFWTRDDCSENIDEVCQPSTRFTAPTNEQLSGGRPSFAGNSRKSPPRTTTI